MSVEMPVNEDHEVLGSEFCSGYTDSVGRYSEGFYCPSPENSAALFCCGGATYKYCCTQREHIASEELGNLPLILGAALGATAALAIIILVSCCCCACCPLHRLNKLRQSQKQANNGPVYRMQCSSTASGVANMYSFSNQNSLANSLATTPIDSAASQILVELEDSAGRSGTMARGHTFSRDTLHRNGRAGSSPHLDRQRDPPPPYDATKAPAALHRPGAHHTLPHQRHHHHHQQQHHHQQHQQHQQQHQQQQQSDSPPQGQPRQHFTLPRSHHATLQSARSPITTFPQGPFNPTTTATLSRGPRAAPVPVPVVGPPPQCVGRPPPQGAPQGPAQISQGQPSSSPGVSPSHGGHTFQTHTLRHPASGASSMSTYGMTHSTSSTFNPGPPPQQHHHQLHQQQQQQQQQQHHHQQQQQNHQQQHHHQQQQQNHQQMQHQQHQQLQHHQQLPPPPSVPAPVPVPVPVPCVPSTGTAAPGSGTGPAAPGASNGGPVATAPDTLYRSTKF